VRLSGMAKRLREVSLAKSSSDTAACRRSQSGLEREHHFARPWRADVGDLDEFDVAFVSSPDKSQAAIPSHEQVRQAWTTVNGELLKRFETTS
jgi:hypothetical protein